MRNAILKLSCTSCETFLLTVRVIIDEQDLESTTAENAMKRRVILEPVEEGRLRLDAGTWGTMGVGLGYAIAAAVARPERLSIAVEGDSAFGFSGMECETICRRARGGSMCLRHARACAAELAHIP